MPVYRPAASSILRSFRASGKRHLLLTGGRGSGKTTLLRALMPSLCPDAPMLLTAAVPGRWVEMRDTAAGAAAVIGRFDAALPPGENRMRPVPAGFAAVGLPALQRMAAAGGWAVLDELGYLESGCADFQQSVLDMLKVCRVLAVVRKQDTPFLRALCADPDAFVYDLDCPVPPLGCIVMASGLGRRFGGNKLMAELNGRPLAAHALALAAAPVFAGRIAVTRSAEVEALCRAEGFPVLRHAEPRRSDTVRLGLTALLAQQPDLQGCVVSAGGPALPDPPDAGCAGDWCRAGHDPAAGRTRRHTGQPCAVRPGLFCRPPSPAGGQRRQRRAARPPAGSPPAAHPRRRAAGYRHSQRP